MWLVGLNPGVLEEIRASGLAECMGKERMLFNARAAIAHFQTLEHLSRHKVDDTLAASGPAITRFN
jgi:hypothetical protein